MAADSCNPYLSLLFACAFVVKTLVDFHEQTLGARNTGGGSIGGDTQDFSYFLVWNALSCAQHECNGIVTRHVGERALDMFALANLWNTSAVGGQVRHLLFTPIACATVAMVACQRPPGDALAPAQLIHA